MSVSLPAEIKANEHSVGLVPSLVKELSAQGRMFKLKRLLGAALRHQMQIT